MIRWLWRLVVGRAEEHSDHLLNAVDEYLDAEEECEMCDLEGHSVGCPSSLARARLIRLRDWCMEQQ